jgi:hypothetical protein
MMGKTPKYVYARGGKPKGKYLGETQRACFEGCRGRRVSVRWPDGKMTYPCTRGLKVRKDGNLQIE